MPLQQSNRAISQAAGTGESKSLGNFGAMRLLLAAAVVFGHTPELIDGDRHREPLTRLFGTGSLGEAAVLGFFLLSGYLLTTSIRSSASIGAYLTKRVARIYPGFIVACLFCYAVVAPLAGGGVTLGHLPKVAFQTLTLQTPEDSAAFVLAPHPALDGALWTIKYEFGCYLLLVIVFACGMLKHPRLLLGLTIAWVALTYAHPQIDWAAKSIVLGAPPRHLMRFTGAFMTGVCFRLFLSENRRNGLAALVGLALLLPALTVRPLAEPALLCLGGYALLWICERRNTPVLGRVGGNIDLSYGLYLYAWPLQNLLAWKLGIRSPLTVDLIVLIAALCCATISWTFVERPAIRAAIARTGRVKTQPVQPATMVVEEAGAP